VFRVTRTRFDQHAIAIARGEISSGETRRIDRELKTAGGIVDLGQIRIERQRHRTLLRQLRDQLVTQAHAAGEQRRVSLMNGLDL
jgi:hypothetical protein